MRSPAGRRVLLGALCALAMALGMAPVAHGAFDDPLMVFKPAPPPPPPSEPSQPPPTGTFEGPCGVAIDAGGRVYVSDYYHHTVDLFGTLSNFYPYGYLSQISPVDLLEGPCALTLDGAGHLYVNDFHRSVIRFTTSPFDAGTVIAGAPVDSAWPTGVAVDQDSGDVYVDERTRVAVFDSAGAPKGTIASGTLQDGYGIAASEFPATDGRVYVPDAQSGTIKIYAPGAAPTDPPVQVIDGADTPGGHFTSLRNAAIAVDDHSGEVYVTDVVRPEFSELSETVVDVFDSSGAYEGRLKRSIENALPPGLAVDNSATATQGRVYVTTGNTDGAAIYVYPPHAATSVALPLSQPSAPSGASGAGSAPPAPQSAASAVADATAATAPPAGETEAAAPPAARAHHRTKPRRAHRHPRRPRGGKR